MENDIIDELDEELAVDTIYGLTSFNNFINLLKSISSKEMEEKILDLLEFFYQFLIGLEDYFRTHEDGSLQPVDEDELPF